MGKTSNHHHRFTRDSLRANLQHLGISEGDLIVVHSSLRGLGWVAGGATTVIDALLDAVGDKGTVIFPTLTGSEQDGPDQPPRMHVTDTPCWTGTIPEAARHRSDGHRSLHPTHSVVAIGADAASITSGHETGVSPCDATSPWGRLGDANGRILLLGGVTQQSNTTLHAIEERVGLPYHLQPAWTDGQVTEADSMVHLVRNRLHQWGWDRDFTRINDMLLEDGVMRCGQVGASTSCLIEAHKLTELLAPMLQRDPLFLLTDQARAGFSQ